MKILLAQPAIKRFEWELEVLLTNMRGLGVKGSDVILLFTKHDESVPQRLYEKYGVQCYVYPDARFDKKYIPSVRPFLLWQFFAAHPEMEQEQFFYIDSDIIFREWPDFATLPFDPSKVYGADVSSYLAADYVLKCQRGPEILSKMAEICGVTTPWATVEMARAPGIGAQLVLNSTTAAFWERAYFDSNAIYQYLLPIDTNIQKWTAEMWAQQWGWIRDGKKLTPSKELDFSRPTDPIEKWDQYKIMHNAGVVGSGEMFFKGEWVEKTPFGSDFSAINPAKVSAKYVEAINAVVVV